MSLWRFIASLVLLVFALAAPAAAAEDEEDIVPPGNSAIDQYRETLPAPSGGQVTGGGSDRSPEEVLGKKNVERLEKYGADGEAVAELAAESAPTAAGGGGSGTGARLGGSGTGSQGSGSSPVGEVVGQATGVSAPGDGGLGWLLPLVLALAAIGAVAYAVVRRRAQNS